MSRVLDVSYARSWGKPPLQLLENCLSVQKLSSVGLVQADLDLAAELFKGGLRIAPLFLIGHDLGYRCPTAAATPSTTLAIRR
jgi:hypothetical protein